MTHDALFQPYRLGDLELPNRIAMAPLTRNRATPDGLAPQDINATYYRQRASAGLLITEATQISQQGQGYALTPGIFSPAQIAGWRKVTDAVHAAGGRIFAQLWHVGRISHVDLQPNGGAPVAPSAVQANTKTFVAGKFVPVSEPRALETSEIAGIVADFGKAAANAKAAGFDGVEIHGANGYLPDQFLRDSTNKRTDEYGGSVENRIRFTLEIVDAVKTHWDAKRIGIRIAPVSPANDVSDSNPTDLFMTLTQRLSAAGLGYLHVVEGSTGGPRDNLPFDYAALKKAFSGAYMANNGYTPEMAEEAVRNGRADLVAFGKLFISNPDLVERIRRNAPLNEWNQKTFYGGAEEGYTDYPALETAAA